MNQVIAIGGPFDGGPLPLPNDFQASVQFDGHGVVVVDTRQYTYVYEVSPRLVATLCKVTTRRRP